MVTVEQIKVKEKKYWRLVHTIRIGKKTTHRVRYIGKALPTKKMLEQLKKTFLKDILGQKYKYLSKEDYEAIEKKKSEYIKDVKRLGKLEREERLKEFIIRFTYDSNKLAGVDITLRQTSLILKEGIIPKGFKNYATAKLLENHEKGIRAITKHKGKFDLKFIKKLHLTLMNGVWDEIAGKTRDEIKSDVEIAGTPYIPPKWQNINKEIDYFFKWYKSENRKLHPLELASLVHLKLISLQPFRDGNSRLSRLLMNWVLWKTDYPLVDIPIEDLEEYNNVLDKFQLEKKDKPFIDYIIKKYLNR